MTEQFQNFHQSIQGPPEYANGVNDPGSGFDFNFPADPTELHPALQRIVAEESLARAQAEEARVRTAVQLVVREELKQVLDEVLDDLTEGQTADVAFWHAREQLVSRMDAAAEKAREGR